MQADSIVENYEGGSPVEEISYHFSIPQETIRLVLEYAQTKHKGRRPRVKVFFDHNIPRRRLKGHYVSLALEMNWSTLRNGDLLRAAEDDSFDVMVTADQDLSYQRNLSGWHLDLVVLSTNNWNIIQRNTASIERAVNAATPGSFEFVIIRPFETD